LKKPFSTRVRKISRLQQAKADFGLALGETEVPGLGYQLDMQIG
jgi:hypothetical protein